MLTDMVAGSLSEQAVGNQLPSMQGLVASISNEWKGDIERLGKQILQDTRLATRGKCGWVPLLFVAAVVIVAFGLWLGWLQHQAQRVALRRESEATDVLARYNHESIRKLLAEVTYRKALPGWLCFPDVNGVDWLNVLIEQMWPKVSAAAVTKAHEILDPQLKANKPKWVGDISIPQFTLGPTPPRVKGFKTYRGNTGDDAVFEIDGVWASSMIVALKIKLLPEQIPLLPASINLTAFFTKYLSKIIFVKMAITDVGFSGKVRIVLSGLSDEFPVVDTLQISLVELPRFSFGVRLLEYLNLMVLPGLESFVHYFIRDVILAPYTLPEALTIPIKEGATTRHPPPAGMLFVKVVEATNIPNVDWRSLVSKPDCFVELSVRNKVSKKTRVVWNKRCPKWDQDFKFLVHFPEHQQLQLVLRDYDRVLGSKEVGRAHVPIKAMPPNLEQQLWVEVKSSHKGFGSLRALTSAMEAMKASSHLPGGHGAQVSQVQDPGGAGGLGFTDVYTGAPQVHEVVPPSELGSDDEASLAIGDTSAGVSSPDATSASRPVEQLSDVAVRPGTCNSRGECSAFADNGDAMPPPAAASSPTVLPSSSTEQARLNRHSIDETSRRSSGEYSIAPSTVGSSAGTRQSTLDAMVAAARKRKRKEPCKLHLILTYVQIGQDTVQRARTAGSHADVEPGTMEAKVLSALRGGVLEVKIRRAALDSPAPTARQVVVTVGERKKATEAAGGSKADNVKGLDTQEEVLEFVVDGDVADQPDAHMELQVFDMHWISDNSDMALWGLESRHQMATEPATVTLPLSDVIHKRSLHKAWQVGGDGEGRTPLLLDVEFEWLPVMETSR